jgi:trehalose-phosphatase
VLRILHFDGGIEICAATMSKGDVVRQIAASLGNSYAMAYLGDDVTDEDAFLALKGIGLSVLVRDLYRETSADVWIRPPNAVIEFLERWAHACHR